MTVMYYTGCYIWPWKKNSWHQHFLWEKCCSSYLRIYVIKKDESMYQYIDSIIYPTIFEIRIPGNDPSNNFNCHSSPGEAGKDLKSLGGWEDITPLFWGKYTFFPSHLNYERRNEWIQENFWNPFLKMPRLWGNSSYLSVHYSNGEEGGNWKGISPPCRMGGEMIPRKG